YLARPLALLVEQADLPALLALRLLRVDRAGEQIGPTLGNRHRRLRRLRCERGRCSEGQSQGGHHANHEFELHRSSFRGWMSRTYRRAGPRAPDSRHMNQFGTPMNSLSSITSKPKR